MDEERGQSEEVKLRTWTPWLWGVLAFVVFFFTLSLIIVYAAPRHWPGVAAAVRHAPYPIVLLDYRSTVTFADLAANMASVRRFYENQDFSQIGVRIDFSTDDGKKRLKMREKEVLNKLMEDRAIMLLARERGISVTEEAAEQGVRRQMEEYGTEAQVREKLERLYGWTLDDFERLVVIPQLYEEKLYEQFASESATNERAYERIRSAKAALSAEAFDAVAKTYSEGSTGDEGGELGWFSLEDLAPELRKPVMLQKVGEPGDIVESSLGFHIVLVDEVKKEDGADLYRLRQIFTRKVAFADWLTREMRELSILVLSPEYRYNHETAQSEFRGEGMRQFEADLYKKNQGDPLFLF